MPRRGHTVADHSAPLFHSDAEPIALVEDFNDLVEGEPAAGTQADMNVARCITEKIGRLTVVVAAQILNDKRKRRVVVIELALQPASIGQRIGLDDIHALIVKEAGLLTGL